MTDFHRRVESLLTELQRACLGEDHATIIVASLSLAAHLLGQGPSPMPAGVLALLERIVDCNEAFIRTFSDDVSPRES